MTIGAPLLSADYKNMTYSTKQLVQNHPLFQGNQQLIQTQGLEYRTFTPTGKAGVTKLLPSMAVVVITQR